MNTGKRAGRFRAGALLLTASVGKRSLTLRPVRRSAGNGLKTLALLVKSNTKRAALKKLVRIRTLDVFLQIGGENAAFIALATGFLQTLSPLAPKAKIVCRPSFHGDTKAYLRCIAEARLGILLAAWLRWRRTQQASQRRNRHGPSHRGPDADDA